MNCADQERCQGDTPEKFIACVEDDNHHCADCFKFTQTEELAELRRKAKAFDRLSEMVRMGDVVQLDGEICDVIVYSKDDGRLGLGKNLLEAIEQVKDSG